MSRIVPLVVALLIAGCAAVPVERDPGYRVALAQGALALASAEGPVLTVVQGSPYAQISAERDRTFLRGVRQAVSHLGVRLVTDEAEAGRPEFRLVLLLEPVGEPQAAAVCADPRAIATERPGEVLRVRALFCEGARPLGDASGHSTVTGPEDERLVRLVRQTTLALFPAGRRAYADRYYHDYPFRTWLGLGIGIRL
jgi:hypothetical protein